MISIVYLITFYLHLTPSPLELEVTNKDSYLNTGTLHRSRHSKM